LSFTKGAGPGVPAFLREASVSQSPLPVLTQPCEDISKAAIFLSGPRMVTIRCVPVTLSSRFAFWRLEARLWSSDITKAFRPAGDGDRAVLDGLEPATPTQGLKRV
jgi:hypothetical protein